MFENLGYTSVINEKIYSDENCKLVIHFEDFKESQEKIKNAILSCPRLTDGSLFKAAEKMVDMIEGDKNPDLYNHTYFKFHDLILVKLINDKPTYENYNITHNIELDFSDFEKILRKDYHASSYLLWFGLAFTASVFLTYIFIK